METEAVYIPVPAEERREIALNERLRTFEGARVGLLGNWKPNANVLLAEMGRLLEAEGASVVRLWEKHSHSMPAPIPMLDEIAESCDFGLTAVGDCGSCTSWCVNDAIELEKRGIPALSFVTSPFMVLARYEIDSLGIPDLAIGEIGTYPFGGLRAEAVRHEAAMILPRVAELLVAAPAHV